MATFAELPPLLQALIAGLGTLLLTAAGAALVVFGRLGRGALFDAMLGFAAGVMLAAAYWSLLEPAIAIAAARGDVPWVPAMTGLIAGAVFLGVADRLLPHLHPTLPITQAEGPRTQWSVTTLLILAITLHNIPEGLAVGVAFGTAAAAPAAMPDAPSFGAAVALAIGIALQNVPEGAAVALPLRAAGLSRWRSFLAGTAGTGAILAYALAFAAGAMIYVVLEELVPSAHQSGRGDLATSAAMGGFTLMMVLDVALG